MTYLEWLEKACKEEPGLSRGIFMEDVWNAAYRAGLDRAVELAQAHAESYASFYDERDGAFEVANILRAERDGDLEAVEAIRKILEESSKNPC